MYGLSAVFVVVALSDDAKLSGLAIEGATNGESISLSPSFTANTGNYTATVPYNIDAVTLTATKNESNATVAITNDDDDNTKNEANLDLDVGDTTLTVTVTAQDGSTKTYTITVTRSTTGTLVSNTGQTRSNESGAVQSQPFTTGSNLGGYTLTSVDVGFQGDNVRTRLFHIVPNQGNGEPDLSDPTKFITLTTPRTTIADKIHTFAAPADANLAANTTYHLYLANSDGGVPGNIHRTSSNTEDDGGAPGWSIGNKRYWRNGNSGPWTDDTTNIVRMQINGRNALPSTDATLSGLAIEGATNGETVDLTPTFAAGTLTYTAAVAYGIDAVTLTATTNHSGALVTITDDDDANTKNQADLDLSGGVNTLTVTVTAEDTATTETYTITVTRGSTDATLSSLMIQDTANGETVDLNPAFIADTLAYTATVAHSINVVTLTATTNQSGAMVAITDDDDAITKNKADLDIDVGANTMTVTVTAEDTTTETYTITVTRAQDPTVPPTVSPTWNLVPSGLSDGDQFRLLFVSAIRRNGSSSDIADYNTFVQEQAAAGHTDIQTYSNRFTAVGCTEAVDARDNTGTTYTSTDKGVPIYWLNGNKVADDYEDFYDESWDDEAASKNELGTASYNISQAGNRPLTGCDDDGTESFVSSQSRALGNGGDITVARPNSSGTGDGPLSSGQKIDKTFTRPMYALSQAFTVTAPADCPTDATWCTTMGVRNTTTTTALAKYEFSGYNISGRNGTLGSTTFFHESTDYTVSRVEQTTFTTLPANTISFRTFFLKAEPPLPDDTILKLGNRAFTVGEDSTGETFAQEEWDTEDNPLNWSNRQDVTVSLTLPDDGQTNHVPSNWSLKPNGLTSGDEFRLLFLSSTKRKATPSDIAVYNAWIQDLAADGHADILTYSSGFTAVGCTEDTDARDNTSTTYTVIERGAPIYWLDGDLVAVDYADFYDGTWQDETNPKNESGTNGPDTSISDNYPITGCSHDGTENVVSGNSLALGSAPIRVAVPGVSNPGTGPLSSSSNLAAPTANRPMYGLSAVFIVAKASDDATLNHLAIVGATDAESINLSPAFDEDTFTYTAAVPYGIDAVTLTATQNDRNDTVTITDDDNRSTKNEAELDLSVGTNILAVTVTSEDTTTTLTYTITVTRAIARPDATQVPDTWGLIPSGLGVGDQFRLIFLSSTKRNASSTSIGDYNTFVQTRAAAGYAAIQSYSSGFTVVGCTQAVDARNNTGTRHNSADRGVPIYWLDGSKVADDYQDFYDETWDNEANPKNESGNNGLDTSQTNNQPWTGCKHNGTEAFPGGGFLSAALGKEFVTTGVPNTTFSTDSPLSSNITADGSNNRPMYGLSEVFQVAETTYVSNLRQSPQNIWRITGRYSQSFTTGSNTNYPISRVDLGSDGVDGTLPLAVAIHETNSDGSPSDTIKHSLAAPSSFTESILKFSAPANATLDGDTTYAIVVTPTGTFSYSTTTSDNEDTAAPGWSIANIRYYESPNPSTNILQWYLDVHEPEALKIAVKNEPPAAPDAPTGLTAAANGISRIDLEWTVPGYDGGSTISGYKIEFSPDGNAKWIDLVTNTGNNDTKYSDTGLSPETTRYYRVFAINSLGTSASSNIANAMGTDPTDVPLTWGLTPSELGVGDQFRLIFLSSTKQDASSANIEDYNTFVQNSATAGHHDIQDYSSGFKVVGCTQAEDARDNTATNYTSNDKGVPIYWLAGNKVADDYEDFYDESWDDEANDNDESGNNGPDTSQIANYPFTGCDHNGTGDSVTTLGATIAVRVGRPNSSSSGNGPLSNSSTTAVSSDTRPMYGLSEVFQVTATYVSNLGQSPQNIWRITGRYSQSFTTGSNTNYPISRVDLGSDGVDGTLPLAVAIHETNSDGSPSDTIKHSLAAPSSFTESILKFSAPANATLDGDTTYAIVVTPTGTFSYSTTTSDNEDTAAPGWSIANIRYYESPNPSTNILQWYLDVHEPEALKIAVKNEPPAAPDAPTGLTAAANGISQIDLEWTVPANNGGGIISGYKIEYSPDGTSEWSNLVVHQFWIDGYKDFNFMRASAVVKRQSTFMAF